MPTLGGKSNQAADQQRQLVLRRRLRLRGRLRSLTESLQLEEPAPMAEIVAAASALRAEFPSDYVQFMSASNGARGAVGGAHLELWPVHHLRDANERLESEPSLVVFGTGSLGERFAFKHGEFVRLPAPGKLAAPRRRGASFVEFLETLGKDGPC